MGVGTEGREGQGREEGEGLRGRRRGGGQGRDPRQIDSAVKRGPSQGHQWPTLCRLEPLVGRSGARDGNLQDADDASRCFVCCSLRRRRHHKHGPEAFLGCPELVAAGKLLHGLRRDSFRVDAASHGEKNNTTTGSEDRKRVQGLGLFLGLNPKT